MTDHSGGQELEYGYLSAQLHMSAQKIERACMKLGLDVVAGKGSHSAAYLSGSRHDSREHLVITIHDALPNNYKILVKRLVYIGKKHNLYTEEDVWIALGIKPKFIKKPKNKV